MELDLIAEDIVWYWPRLALLLGLIAGSFANVCIHRLPLGQSVVSPPSRCPRCGHRIRWWDNIPLISYAFLRARCRSCRASIAIRYPIVEAVNGALWFLLARSLGLSLRGIALSLFASALLVLTLIDLEHQILPDRITLPGIAFGLALSLVPGSPVRPLESFASAAGGYLSFMALALGWERLRGQEALGQGDWKMAAMLGAFLGWQPLLLTIFLATCAGAIVGGALIAAGRGHWQSKLPLGSFLGVAGIAVVFVGEPVIAWYRGFLDV